MVVSLHTQSIVLSKEERDKVEQFVKTADLDQLPANVQRVLSDIFQQLTDRQSLCISIAPEEVISTSAAAMLDISRPQLMTYIREGRIASREVNGHHLLKTHDILAFREELIAEQQQAIFDLMDLEEELNQ